MSGLWRAEPGNFQLLPRAVDTRAAFLFKPTFVVCVSFSPFPVTTAFHLKRYLPPPVLRAPPPGGGAGEGRPSPHPGVVKVMVINPGALSLLFGVNWLAAFGLKAR